MDLLLYVKEKINLPSLLLGAGSVLAGTACAAIRGNVEWFSASLCLLFALFCQIGANLGYFYTRAKRNFDMIPHPYFEGKEDKLSDLHNRVLREGSFGSFIIAAMIGLTIMSTAPHPFLVFCIAIIVAIPIAVIFLSKKPIFGTYRGLILTWLLFGPIGVIGTAWVQLQQVTPNPWAYFDNIPGVFAGPAMGFLALNVHLMFSYVVHRITPHVKGGVAYHLKPGGVQATIFVNGLLMLVILFIGVFTTNFLKPLFSLVPAFLGFSMNTFLVIRMRNAPVGELKYMSILEKVNFFMTGFTLLIFWLAEGYPSASMHALW